MGRRLRVCDGNAGDPMNAKPRLRALALAYFFPPLGGGGVQRTLKHVKYLPDEGFETIVLTTRFGWSPTRDPTLSSEIPAGTVVIRAPELPLQVIKWGVHGLLRRARLPTSATNYIGWPDEMVGWVPGATWHALKAIRRYRPDVLYSTSSPVSAHLVALIVHRVTGIPWVADFRDAWTRNPQGEPLSKPLGHLSAAMERAVVGRAQYLVVVDESVELLGIEHEDPRLVVIRNGVDPEDMAPTSARTPGERFRISYVGALYGERNAAPVFAALRALIGRGVFSAEEIEVRLVGHRATDTDAHFDGVPVSTQGYVDHRAAVAEMVAADVLLFYAPASNRGSSGKIYEYLASGRPILCVAGSDNFAFQLVAELGAGPCVEPGDQSAIEDVIERLYGRWRAGELDVDPEVKAEALRRFSRPVLARELAAVLEAAMRTG
jgi:glycosyltransferase involved in cell wall biosynthesis